MKFIVIYLSLSFLRSSSFRFFFGEVRGGPFPLHHQKKNQSCFRIGKELGDFFLVFENGGKTNNVYMLCFFIYTQIHLTLHFQTYGSFSIRGGEGKCNKLWWMITIFLITSIVGWSVIKWLTNKTRGKQGFLLLKDRIGLFFLYILLLGHLVLARLTFLIHKRANL